MIYREREREREKREGTITMTTNEYINMKNSLEEDIICAGLKFLERSKRSRLYRVVGKDDTQQGKVSKGPISSGHYCERHDLVQQRRNAVCEENLLERDGLVFWLKDYVLLMQLQLCHLI